VRGRSPPPPRGRILLNPMTSGAPPLLATAPAAGALTLDREWAASLAAVTGDPELDSTVPPAVSPPPALQWGHHGVAWGVGAGSTRRAAVIRLRGGGGGDPHVEPNQISNHALHHAPLP